MRAILLLCSWLVLTGPEVQDRVLFKVRSSKVVFVSDAPLEYITATNEQANGILDPNARTFAVQIPMVDFRGFNSPLQREHFNENYMLSRKFPNAVFSGRVIEGVDLKEPGEYSVRAKGQFTLKGISRERIIPCELVVNEQGVQVRTSFDVLLDEHDIRVPRVVQQKISSVVQVQVDLFFADPQQPQ